MRFDLGPGMVRRENVQRVAMLTANVAGADSPARSSARAAAIAAAVRCRGYRVTFGGQFEEASAQRPQPARARRARPGGDVRAALRRLPQPSRTRSIVLVNLPLALIGGVFAVALGDGVLSVASLVGFITLFGIATRNGVLLVSHYQHLISEEGLPLAEAVRRGSHERLAPVLMTALTAGLALIPLVLARRRAGQRDPEPDGGGHPGRAAHLDVPQPGGGAGALRAVGKARTATARLTSRCVEHAVAHDPRHRRRRQPRQPSLPPPARPAATTCG